MGKFLFWGGYHGVILSVESFLPKYKNKLIGFISWPLTFILIILSMAIFNSQDTIHALNILKTMLTFKADHSSFAIKNYELIIIALFFICQIALAIQEKYKVSLFNKKWIHYIWIVIAIPSIIFLRGTEKAYVYFSF